jgi:antitoxin ParD1/3/4
MANVTEPNIVLDQDQLAFIDAKIATGNYGNASEVVRAGLFALADRDAHVETWLRTEVASTFDLSLENPNDVVSIDDAFAQVRAARQKRAAA